MNRRRAELVPAPDPRQFAFPFLANEPPPFVTMTRRDGYIERVRVDRISEWIEKNIKREPAR